VLLSYKNTLEGLPIIYGGLTRRVETQRPVVQSPPIQIFHSIFDDFTHFLNDPDVQPTRGDLIKVYQLMQTLSSIHMQEDYYGEIVREGIGHILDTAISEEQNPDSTRPDGVIMVELGNTCIPYSFLEPTQEGIYDPTSQASLSMRRSWIHNSVGYNHIHLDLMFDF
jgi:hypothetical protein